MFYLKNVCEQYINLFSSRYKENVIKKKGKIFEINAGKNNVDL